MNKIIHGIRRGKTKNKKCFKREEKIDKEKARRDMREKISKN